MNPTHLVAIDIGHGLNTYPPSKGIGTFAEFTFNNAVGKLAKELAEVNGFEVFLSQPFDANEVPLIDRTGSINLKQVDFGFSIHANASNDGRVTGHEFWHWHSDEQARKMCAYADANAIALLPNKRRGIKVSEPKVNVNFGILRVPRMPFVLGEFGFFTNTEERALLLKESFQLQCAKVVVKTFCDYTGKEFRTMLQSRPPETIKIPQWKVEGLQNLFKDGLVTDYEGWLPKLDEPASNWMVFTVLDRINQIVKGKQDL
jgi:N-acetylmuramoyl-L-alanine amidase